MTHQQQDVSSETEQEQTPLSTPPTKQEGGFWEIIRFTIIALAIVIPVRMFIAQPFVVSGESMYPTFNDGDYLIVDEISYRLGDPNRGDVIIFRYPLQPDRFFIKRIIALPSETIEFENDILTVTTTEDEIVTINEPYIEEFHTDEFNLTLAEDEYYVMGDNRDASSDSRIWGPLPEEFITGRALVRLLPTSEIGILPGDYKQEDNQE